MVGGTGRERLPDRRFPPEATTACPVDSAFPVLPASDFGYPYIEALAASGITGGCGGDLYCPDAPLTQMAIFRAKALGLHWPY